MSKVSVMKEKNKAQYKATAGNKRFHASGGDVRRNICAYLEAYRPLELL